MTREIVDIAIIGGGPVGLWAAFYAGLRGMTVKVIESLSELGGQPAILYPEKRIYDIPAYPAITGRELTVNLLKQLERFEDRIMICLNEEVQTFEKKDGLFTLQTNRSEHLSRAIVIACGNGAFTPRLLGVEGEETYAGQNLYYNVHHFEQFAGQRVVICGGGDSAVDWANHLDGIAESVTLIHRRDAFRAHEHSVEQLQASSVQIMTPYVPVALSGLDGRATHLTVQKVKGEERLELPLDALIVSFGFATNNKTIKNWNVAHQRNAITVSSVFETSQEGVYAIGDAATYDGRVDLLATGFGEAPIAVNQAIKAIYPERDNRPVHSTSLIK